MMNIHNCPHCGGSVRSVSIGWICDGCRGFIDMHGGFHEHVEKPFLSPMTNADRIRAMSVEKLARLLVHTVSDGCPPDMDEQCRKDAEGWDGCDKCWCQWLKRPAEATQ